MSKSSKKTKVFAGRYEYVKPLGRGAGGSVYLAEDLHVDRRQVALKVLSAEACQTVQGKMLRREFEILSKLDHPNLVQVYDYGSLPGGGVFLAEEYIDGFSLQDARALLEPEALTDVTFQILLGLSYLHGMGWIHRDIKPANVMLLWLDDASALPMVKLVDFGLSSMNPKKDTLRGGTRSYMAPEIIRGEKGELRSDLYSLGVTLYYALCGVLPFGPRSKEDPPPTEEDFRPPEPHRLNPEVPLALSRFTMALLRQLPDFEYADAGEALQDLVRDTEFLEEWSGGVLANSLDVAAPPVIKGYFERGILPRREDEHEEIVERVVNDEASGVGVMQLLTGDEGIGKSRLMREIRSSCKLSERLVVSARCKHGMPPYALVHKLLSRIVEIGTSRDIHQIERYKSYLTILERVSRLGNATEEESRVDSAWIREAFEDAVVMLHPQKVALFIEDLHLADESSRRFMANWYARSQSFHRPDTVATSRTDKVEDELAACEAVEITELEGVRRSDVEIFFGERLGLNDIPEAWLDTVSTRAQGQPAYLEELCRNLIDRGILSRLSVSDWEIDLDGLSNYQLPRNVRESFRRRFAAVSASGRECLEILTLLRRPILWEDLREIIVDGGKNADLADRTLKSLRWRHLTKIQLTMRGRHVSLLDDVIAEVVVDLSSPKWTRALHRRIGEHLADRWPDAGGDAYEAAVHLKRGGTEEKASTLYEIAGDEAWGRSDYGRAIESFRTAANLREEGPEAAFVHLKLARSLLAGYEPAGCRSALKTAGEFAERTALDWLIYAVFSSAISIAISFGDDEDAWNWLAELRDYLPAMSHQSDVQELEALLLARRGELATAAGKLDACVDRARHFGNRYGLASALVARGDLLHLEGKGSRAAACFEEALEIARDVSDPIVLGRALCHYGAALRRAGKEREGLEFLSESLETLSDGQHPDEWIEALLQIAMCKAALGDLAEARRYALDAQVFARQLDSEVFEARGAFLLGEIDLTEGKTPDAALDEMESQLGRLRTLSGDVRQLAELAIRQAVACKRARFEGADKLLARGIDAAERIGAKLLVSQLPAMDA
jgi:serine/threonine protein kinase/tetratricopeptide (TPR) repeat protein